jgi:glycoprotein-mannosyl O6-kinase
MVNDLDALLQINRTAGLLIKCGHRRIWGDFVAPEQLWPYDGHQQFDDANMPPYDEKTDIWKIPEICDYFLGDVQGSDAVRFHLFAIHRQCQELKPSLRPTAEEILETYSSLLDELSF